MKHLRRDKSNDKSRNTAVHHGEPWTADEVELLMECWGDLPEHEVAEALGRTIEACRQRWYEIKWGTKGCVQSKVTMTTTTTTTTSRYIGAMDDADDCWWSPEHYI